MSLHILLQLYNVPVQGAKLCNELKKRKTKFNYNIDFQQQGKQDKAFIFSLTAVFALRPSLKPTISLLQRLFAGLLNARSRADLNTDSNFYNISQTRTAALKETPIWWFYNRDNMVPKHPPQTDTRICSIIITPTIQR